ncbi:hypothetical protein Hanom_Chr14g01265401 [Helianthus anomalus]
MNLMFLCLIFSNLMNAIAKPEDECKKEYGDKSCGYSMDHSPGYCDDEVCEVDCANMVPIDQQQIISSFCRGSVCICCARGLGCPNI